MASVQHIFTAPERGVPMVSHQQVMVHTDVGIVGDRYFQAANRHGPDNQLTLIEIENIEAFNSTCGLNLGADAPRRNVVTTGIRLNDLCGQKFHVGPLLLEGLELCEPCRLFKVRTYPQALEFFMGKGGLRTRVLAGGALKVGDPIGLP
jgi:MOSC domain-containing protein YiiM